MMGSCLSIYILFMDNSQNALANICLLDLVTLMAGEPQNS